MVVLEAITNGVTYNLSDGSIVYRTSNSGLGAAPVRRYSRRGPRQHGDTDADGRLEPRLIQLGFIMTPSTQVDHYARRALLLDAFAISDDPIRLRWTFPNGAMRQIDGFYSGGLDFATEGGTGLAQRLAVEIRCPNPVFYDPAPITESVSHSTWSAGTTVPTPIPMPVGASQMSDSVSVTYLGSWPAYPVLTVHGPITSPVITHQELDLSIPLTRGSDASIGTGEYWQIDLSSGAKTITDHEGVSHINTLADANDLSTFRLVPGVNTIGLTGSGSNVGSRLDVVYLERFIGM